MTSTQKGELSAASGRVLTIEEKVDVLATQINQLAQMIALQNEPVHAQEATVSEVENIEEEVDNFLSHHKETNSDGKVCLPKFALLQMFDGTMKDTKSFVSSIILIIIH